MNEDRPAAPRFPPLQFSSRWWFIVFAVCAVLAAATAPSIRTWPSEKQATFLWMAGPAAALGLTAATLLTGGRQAMVRAAGTPVAVWWRLFPFGMFSLFGPATTGAFCFVGYHQSGQTAVAVTCAMFLFLGLANLQSFGVTSVFGDGGITAKFRVGPAFVPWERFCGYAWDEDRPGRLVLKLERVTWVIDVPREHYAAVAELLEAKLPTDGALLL
jgi:hypothetical protein